MHRGTSLVSSFLALVFVLLTVNRATAQEKLQDCEVLLEKAKSEMADVLSPETFHSAQRAYDEAVKRTEKGESLDKIRKLVDKAMKDANTAIRNSDLARVTFVDVLPAREKALEAQAPDLSRTAWQDADRRFYEAANALERGNANEGKKKGAEAEDLFLTAELLAIKEAITGETDRLIKNLEDDKVDEDAPETLAKAREQLKKADDLLDSDRYRKTDAESLNKVALYEARHAKSIADRVRSIDKQKTSPERVTLDFEDKLMSIAKGIGLSLQFDDGIGSQADLLRKEVDALKSERDQLSTELNDLKKQYAGTQEDRRSIKEQLEAQRIKRERIERISALFDQNEATVLLDGEDVIIRLEGFTFPSGTAIVEPKYFSLLTKVQQAISELPNSQIAIEGNTDSMGEDNYNLQLSQKRADAIRTYLVANLGLNPSRIIAVGNGESKPIASNETGEGRAINRRIDIVMSPGS